MTRPQATMPSLAGPRWAPLLALGLLLACCLPTAWAKGATEAMPLAGALPSGAEWASSVKIAMVLTALSFLPAAFICMTCFVRIAMVLSMLRHAVGLPETPPNVVVILLSLFLTLMAMQPVADDIQQRALTPLTEGRLSLTDAATRAVVPLKEFMLRQTREQDLVAMLDAAGAPRPTQLDEVRLAHLVPAFMRSELRTAFQIGFMIFLPFLLVDLIVASVLMALGMMMVPPATVSLPIKLLLCVLIDGWNIVTKALLGTIH